MAAPDIIGLNPKDGIEVRTFLEALRGRVESDRASWDPHWKQLTAFFSPYATKNVEQTNTGQRRDYRIINETGLLALRTLGAGMLTGMSNPTRSWLKIRPTDPELIQSKSALKWCEDTEQDVYRVFLKSNVYQTLLNLYTEEGLYGTSAFILEDDPDTTVRCHPLTVGNYSLVLDDKLRICGLVRQVSMTIDQVVTRFGRENVSDSTLTQWQSNAGGTRETRRTVVHVILRGDYLGDQFRVFPYQSIWYELDSFNAIKGLLRRSGFMENPLICGRWRVTGEDVYGRSAGMDCLGSVMSLQAYEERIAQAAEKGFNPPMIFGTEVDIRKNVLLPGDFIFANTADVSASAKPMYEVKFQLGDGMTMLQRIEARINDAMYRSLFQMFSESDRRDITAEEIRARQQEKMQVLGPVVERNVEEVLAPLVKRTIAIMERRGLLRPLPPELKNKQLNLEFVSILAQAQKIGAITNIQTWLGIIGQEVAVDQGILDNVDMDAVAQKTAELTGVPSDVLRDPEDVAKLRANRQQQQQMAQAADNAQKLAAAAQNLSGADDKSVATLASALPGLAGGNQ